MEPAHVTRPCMYASSKLKWVCSTCLGDAFRGLSSWSVSLFLIAAFNAHVHQPCVLFSPRFLMRMLAISWDVERSTKLGQRSKKFILSDSSKCEVKEAIGWLASLLPRNRSIANNKIGIFPFISVLWREAANGLTPDAWLSLMKVTFKGTKWKSYLQMTWFSKKVSWAPKYAKNGRGSYFKIRKYSALM